MNTPRYIPPQSQAVWSNAGSGVNGTSAVFNSWNLPFVSAFGNVSGATTITLLFSADGTTFYAGPTVTTTGAGNFYLNATVGVQYLQLQSSNNVTATAVLSAK